MLITYSSFLDFFGMSENIPNNRVTASIIEAQDFDIKPVIGEAFFYDVILKYGTSPADANIVKVVEGGTYTDCDGNTMSFAGLAKALNYYTLARFRKKQPINDTNFGVVVKRDLYSDPLDTKALSQSIDDARSSGMGYLNETIKFLQQNKDIYPLFKGNEDNYRKPLRITPVARKPRLNNYRNGIF
jgi:hypothetical protein